MRSRSSLLSKAGFTLVEILVSSAIMVTVLGASSFFMIEIGRSVFVTSEKLNINTDVRQLTNELIKTGRGADLFYTYPKYDDTVDDAVDGEYGTTRLGDGETGDLLLLVYEGSVPLPENKGYPITKIVGIYRTAASATDPGPVKMFTVDNISVADSEKKPEQLIPNVSEIPNHKEIVEFATGLANGNLFYNFKDMSVMLNAQIVHGNSAKQITDTYNLTIKPRGGNS